MTNQNKRIQRKKKNRERRNAKQRQSQSAQKLRSKYNPQELLEGIVLNLLHVAKTPIFITEEIERFASKFGSDQRFHDIDLSVKGCNANDCFTNVDSQVKSHGGKMVVGQVIWENKYWLETEFHAIWMSDDGELRDITPDQEGETRRYFVITPDARYDGSCGRKHFYPKVNEAETICEFYSAQSRIMARYKSGRQLSGEDSERFIELSVASMRELTRLSRKTS